MLADLYRFVYSYTGI